jgi:type II secretory pathway pseudopilin PulG
MSSRSLVAVLVIAAAIVALLPVAIARSRAARTMRAGLGEVLEECRTAYASAASAADSLAVDSLHPALRGRVRPGDPPCGAYRRRNLIPSSR